MSDPISVFEDNVAQETYLAAYDNALKLWSVPYESSFVKTEIGETHVLLFLHGASASSTMWYNSVEELSRYYKVVAVDMVLVNPISPVCLAADSS